MPSAAYGSRLGQLLQQELASARQALADGGDPHAHVHQARKAIRRARSMLALPAGVLEVDRIDALLRRTCDSLGALRDAHAVAGTARAVGARLQDDRWLKVAQVLLARADRRARSELALDPGFAKRRAALARGDRGLRALPWATLAAGDLHAGLVRQARRVEKAAAKARKDPCAENLHRWRRRVRRLRMQLDALDSAGLRIDDRDPQVSKRLHRLSDALGWRQDLEVLAAAVRGMRALPDRRELLAQLAREDLQLPADGTGGGPQRSREGSSSGSWLGESARSPAE